MTFGGVFDLLWTELGDTTAPQVLSVVANAVGDVVVTVDENLNETSGLAGNFTLDSPGGVTFIGISIEEDTITLSPSRPIYEGDTVTLDYTPGGIKDLAGNLLAAISNYSVTNNSEVPVPDTTAPVFQSAAISADGLSALLTYGETLAAVPAPSAYSFGGDPTNEHAAWAYGVGTSIVTIPLSKPVYQGQTVTITSTDGPEDAAGNAAANLNNQALTNNSTLVAPSLVTSGLVHLLSADAGLTHTGDGTNVTAAADQSGTGSNLVPSDAGGPVYRATGWIDGTPMIEWQANDGLELTHASVMTPFGGSSAEWTVQMLVWPNANSNGNNWWAIGEKFRVSGNHWISQTTGAQQMRANGNHAGLSGVTRIVTSYTEYTKAPFPTILTWRKVGTILQCFVGDAQLTYDDPSFATNLITHNTFIWGRTFSAGNETGSALYSIKRGLIYSRAITNNEVFQNTRYLGVLGGVPQGGALLGETVAA